MSDSDRRLRLVRVAILVTTPLALAGLIMAGQGNLLWVPLLVGGAALGALNRRTGLPTDAATFDKRLFRQAMAFTIIGLAPIPVIVAVATGVIKVEKPEVIYVSGPLMTFLGGFIFVQAWRFRRAGGGGADAVAAWNKYGLDAVRTRNSQLQSDEELRTAIERHAADGSE